VALDKKEAYRWYLKAAKQGNGNAQKSIDFLCKESPGVCK